MPWNLARSGHLSPQSPTDDGKGCDGPAVARDSWASPDGPYRGARRWMGCCERVAQHFIWRRQAEDCMGAFILPPT